MKQNKKRNHPGRRFYQLFGLLLSLLLLSACGGGGGGGAGSANPPQTGGAGSSTPPPPVLPTKGTASGTLIIPPNNTVEIEPNDSINQAQAVSGDLSITGLISETDPGFFHPVGQATLGDLYRLTATGPVRITLSIAANDLNVNDLDLLLMDTAGNVFDVSEGFAETEFLETSTGGEFLVGIFAFDGASAYVLDFAPKGGLASAQSPIPVGAEFVPGEILVKLKNAGLGNAAKPGIFLAQHSLTHK